MATGLYFVITDGTTTCTFADGNDPSSTNTFKMMSDSWAPAVAGLSVSQLGGRGPYADVVEDIPIGILGTSVPDLLSNAQTLNRLIEQAERWARGENVAPVLVKYSPRGATASSAAAPLQAVILGRDPQDQSSNVAAVSLPATFDREIGQLVISAGRLRFLRRGAWVLSAAVTGTSAAVANPGPYPITGMATHPNISPAVVQFIQFAVGTAMDVADSKPILLLAQQGSDLQIAEAEAGTATAYTSFADTATNLPRGGHVLRYTPTLTTEVLSGPISLSSMTSAARRFAFFAAVRNNSVTTTWQMRVGALIQVNTTGPVNAIEAYTRLVTIDTAHTRPRYVPLGIVSLPASLKAIQFAITASAASGTLDIDYVIALAIDNPYARAIQLDNVENAGGYIHTVFWDLFVDPRPLTGLTPSVYRNFETTSDNDYMGYYGDAYPVAVGTTFQAALMCKRSDARNVDWVYENTAGAANVLTLGVARQNAYLIPE